MLASPGNQRVVSKVKALDANEIKRDLKLKLFFQKFQTQNSRTFLSLDFGKSWAFHRFNLAAFDPHLGQSQGCEPKNTLTANNLEFNKSLSAWLNLQI